MKRIFVLLAVGASALAHAGGIAFPFVVESFERVSLTDAQLVLRPREPGEQFPKSCPTVRVSISLHDKWQKPDSDPVSEVTHRDALDYLEQVDSGDQIVFGFFSLKRTGVTLCDMEVRGLLIRRTKMSGRTVFSYYAPD